MSLASLERMVGSWITEATHPAMPGVVVHGTVEVEWLEGKKFLIHRSTTDHPDFPHAISIIGVTGAETAGAVGQGQLTLQYYDSRGVHRVYQAEVDDKALRISIDADGMAQRITYAFAADGSIEGTSKMREGDKPWHDDLAITYRRETSSEMRDADDYRRIPKKAIKIDLPNATQVTEYTCGASALQAICSYFGVGPEDEWDFEEQMGMPTTGADPIHITRAAKRYGLEVQEFRPMTASQLEKCLDKGRPVILMLQAWSGRSQSYKRTWDEGHYVVAIGYDDEVFYVEDPSIHGSRGYITREELDARWHDVEGAANAHTEHLGIAIWRKKPTKLAYARSARHVD